VLAALSPFAASPVTAVPMLTPAPTHAPSSAPESTPTPADRLPYDARLSFVLDGTISSASSKAGDEIPAHLQNDLIVGGRTLAAAGTIVHIRVLDAKPADNPDIYGFIDISFGSLALSDGSILPLRTPAQHLDVNVSAGHQSTAEVENTIGDVYAPTLLFHILRKGRNLTLQPGAVVHAMTEATVIVAPNGTIAITTPAPMVLDVQTPLATYKAAPLITPNPQYHPQAPFQTLTPGTPTPRP
jgi:hypothetical protein